MLFAQDTPDLAPVEEIDAEEIVPDGLTSTDWITAGVLFAATIVVTAVVYRVTAHLVRAGTRAPLGTARLVGRLVATVVFSAGVLYTLGVLGVRIGPLLGALGIAGIAIAFALRDALENFVAGVFLQARRPFNIEDQIATDEWEGTVEDINLRAVVLRTFDGTKVVIPSSTVLRNPIHNLTWQPLRRTTVEVGVAYGSDLSTTQRVLLAAVRSADGVATDPSPDVWAYEFGESSINFAVRFWHRADILSMWSARSAVVLAVKHGLDEAGITIPFPQRTLWFPEGLGASGDASPDGDRATWQDGTPRRSGEGG